MKTCLGLRMGNVRNECDVSKPSFNINEPVSWCLLVRIQAQMFRSAFKNVTLLSEYFIVNFLKTGFTGRCEMLISKAGFNIYDRRETTLITRTMALGIGSRVEAG